MAKKTAKGDVTIPALDTKSLRYVTGVSCDGETAVAAVYDPVKKAILQTNDWHGPNVRMTPFSDIIETALTGGTRGNNMHEFMLQVPEYKAMFDETVSGIEPRFKERDQVWAMVHSYRQSDTRSRFFTVGQVLGYKKDKKYCSGLTTAEEVEKLQKVEVFRQFIDNKDGSVTDDIESNYDLIESYENHEALLAAVTAMKGVLKERKIKGGQIIWGGRAFNF